MSFSFGFSGDDIEDTTETPISLSPSRKSSSQAAETGNLLRAGNGNGEKRKKNTAFPIPGQVLIPAKRHDLRELFGGLPSAISYGCLNITLDSPSKASETGDLDGQGSQGNWGERIEILRRELWDVRVQLMAEEEEGEGGGVGGTGRNGLDVQTGIYEGGFKSWESSFDLVRFIMGTAGEERRIGGRVLEMGCGTALPSLAIFQTYLYQPAYTQTGLSLTLADYNPTVLQLVTLPNLLLSWSRHCIHSPLSPNYQNPRNRSLPDTTQENPASPEVSLDTTWPSEGELEITPEFLTTFLESLVELKIQLNFISGAWSDEFVGIFQDICTTQSLPTSTTTSHSNSEPEPTSMSTPETEAPLLILAAETIYSPFALQTFTTCLLSILNLSNSQITPGTSSPGNNQGKDEIRNKALIGAKKVYFGVGGSLEDFYDAVTCSGGHYKVIREEEEGVRRGVCEVWC